MATRNDQLKKITGISIPDYDSTYIIVDSEKEGITHKMRLNELFEALSGLAFPVFLKYSSERRIGLSNGKSLQIRTGNYLNG